MALRTLRLALVVLPLLSGPHTQDQPSPVFRRDSRGDLAFARARGDTMVTLAIASREGRNAAVAEAVAAVGGTIGYRADDVSYLRARIRIERVTALLRSNAIESAAVDIAANSRPYQKWNSVDPSGDDVGGRPGSIDTVRAKARIPGDDALRRPYQPLEDMDALAMRRRHPGYDGRGVVVAHVEGQIDILAPEMRTAYAIDGRRIPKFADYLTAEDPESEADTDPSAFHPWVAVSEVAATAAEFSAGGKTYRAPRAGQFRFGIFRNWRLCGFLARVDFATFAADTASAANKSCGYGVLYDPATKEVWVDVDKDASFLDSKPMRDYQVRGDFGVFGVDDPKTTDGRESFGFAVQTHPSGRYVAIVVGFGGHATMVAGSVAGNKVPQGLYDGVAPGAQLLEIGYRATASGVTEALIMAFRDPRTDVVLYEQNVFVANGYRWSDGQFAPTIITSRLIAKYRKPYCVPGDNDMGVGITSEHGNARFGFAVGAYQSRDAYRINVGVRVKEHDNQHIVGASGPNGLGEIKPDLMAPSGILTSEITMKSYLPKGGVKGLFSLPAGYGIGGGTSQATPVMAGALALLVGAAKQEKVPYDAQRIWLAMTNGARFIKHLPAHTQGNGVVQVGAAFDLLKAYAARPPVITIESSAPVHTPISGDLTTPNRGHGLYQRTGWTVGMEATREIILTRTSGPSGSLTFAVAAEGNDGTFRVPNEVVLPLGLPVTLSLGVSPRIAGAHSTLITLNHPSVPGHAFRTMATIVAAKPFLTQNDFTIVERDSFPRPGPWASYFVTVPPGAGALTVNLDMTDEARLMIHDPVGREEAFTTELIKSPRGRTILNPIPGVWELGFWVRNDGPELRWQDPEAEIDPPIPFTLTAKILGADLSAQPKAGNRALDLLATNRLAAMMGSIGTVATGSGRTTSSRLEWSEQQVHEIEVPAGTSHLQIDVTARADLDLYLFDCSGKECEAVAAVADSGTPRVLSRANPAAGRWKLVVDGAAIPIGGIDYSVREVMLDPTMGALTAADAPGQRASGAQWTTPVNVWMAKQPPTGWQSFLAFQLQARRSDGSFFPVATKLAPVEAVMAAAP